ncbi:MAG: Asp-tRNA(Asn)/Glu-tRNA(Gln) amidotransferase subunit GatC [Alphaproteobacteria bacterium]|nr:Asp-tRNA(Asn)/Glu-tRNA(Gln) amidotransferase subunit GatC [Alphaproteobacteria bacterium]
MFDKESVKKIAYLARIRITDEDKAVKDFNETLEMLDIISQVDTEGVEIMVSPAQGTLAMGDDKVLVDGIAGELMKSAGASLNNCYVVPKVIE